MKATGSSWGQWLTNLVAGRALNILIILNVIFNAANFASYAYVVLRVPRYSLGAMVYSLLFLIMVTFPLALNQRIVERPPVTRSSWVRFISMLALSLVGVVLTLYSKIEAVARGHSEFAMHIVQYTAMLFVCYLMEWSFAIPLVRRLIRIPPRGLSLFVLVGIVLTFAAIAIFFIPFISLELSLMEFSGIAAGIGMVLFGVTSQDLLMNYRLSVVFIVFVELTIATVILVSFSVLTTTFKNYEFAGFDAARDLIRDSVEGVVCITFGQSVREGDACDGLWLYMCVVMFSQIFESYVSMTLLRHAGFTVAWTSRALALPFAIKYLSPESGSSWLMTASYVLTSLGVAVLWIGSQRSLTHPVVVRLHNEHLEERHRYELLAGALSGSESLLSESNGEGGESDVNGASSSDFAELGPDAEQLGMSPNSFALSGVALSRDVFEVGTLAVTTWLQPVATRSSNVAAWLHRFGFNRRLLIQMFWLLMLLAVVLFVIVSFFIAPEYSVNGNIGLCSRWESDDLCHNSGRMCAWCETSERCVIMDCSSEASLPHCEDHHTIVERCDELSDDYMPQVWRFVLGVVLCLVAYLPTMVDSFFPHSKNALVVALRSFGWDAIVAINFAMFMFWFLQFFLASTLDLDLAKITLISGGSMAYEYFHALEEYRHYFGHHDGDGAPGWRRRVSLVFVYLMLSVLSGSVFGNIQTMEAVAVARSTLAALVLDFVAQVIFFKQLTAQQPLTLFVLCTSFTTVITFKLGFAELAEVLHAWTTALLVLLFIVQSRVLLSAEYHHEKKEHNH